MDELDWMDAQDRVEERRSRAMLLSFAIGAGNAALMAMLAQHPWAQPGSQLAAGAAAMAMHGWGCWEIARALLAWAKASSDLRRGAAEAFKRQALASRRRGA